MVQIIVHDFEVNPINIFNWDCILSGTFELYLNILTAATKCPSWLTVIFKFIQNYKYNIPFYGMWSWGLMKSYACPYDVLQLSNTVKYTCRFLKVFDWMKQESAQTDKKGKRPFIAPTLQK